MDFTIEEYNEEINLTIIEDGDTLEFSIEEVVEEVNITIEEYNGADGQDGLKGDKGDKGDAGEQGIQGVQGIQGIQGEQGIQGVKGDKGDKGDDGLSGIQSIVEGVNITIDNTDPLNPIISAEEGGTTVTKTSDLINDGADGTNAFITAVDIENKADLVGGLVPSSQLPAYVDDVLEFADLPAFPATGEMGKIYVAVSPKNQQYRWSGSSYIQITNGLIASTNDVPEGTNLYFTTARVLATVLSGISFATGGAIVSTDTVLQAFGKIQKQINELLTTVGLNTTAIADEAIKRIEITTTTSITTNTLGTVTGKGQHGRHVLLKNGVNAINIECRTDSASDFISSGEHLGSADITFTAGAGATVNDVYGGTKVLKAGGTYTITRNGNTFNLRIP